MPTAEGPKRWKDHCRERMRSPKHNRHNVRASIVVLIIVGVLYVYVLTTTRIVGLGDSMINSSQHDHQMLDLIGDLIQPSLRTPFVQLFDMGRGNQPIAKIRSRLLWTIDPFLPDAVLLYFGSDCDNDDALLSAAQKLDLRRAYRRNLGFVLKHLQRRARYVVVTGPTLMGELPHGRNPKDAMLDAYRNLTRAVAAKRGIDYIDSRAAFFAALPRGWAQPAGHLTWDGEHLNARGAALVARLVAERLSVWLARPPT